MGRWLTATGWAIVPEKGHWYLVIFKRTNRYWRYCYSKELPAVLSVQDISGHIKELSRLEPNEAKTTLGVNTASDGNLLQQASEMKAASVLWANQMRTGHLNKKDSWILFHSTLWRSLAYPLPAINLSKNQSGEIMSPAIQQLLISLGICRHFPSTNHDWQVWKECLKQVFSYNNLARKLLEDWMQHSSQWFSVHFNNAYFKNRMRHGLDMAE